MTSLTLRNYFISSAIAGVFVAASQFGTDASSPLGFLQMLVVPGYFTAALIFPEGIHSGSADAFVVLIVLFNGLIYGLPLLMLWHWARRRLRQNIKG
jgi:hypothetical protein